MEGGVSRMQKRANIKGEPVLPFDNQSSDSSLKLLTVEDVALFLNISITSVRRMQQRRLVPFIKVGGSVRFLLTDLLSYLKKRRVEPIDK